MRLHPFARSGALALALAALAIAPVAPAAASGAPATLIGVSTPENLDEWFKALPGIQGVWSAFAGPGTAIDTTAGIGWAVNPTEDYPGFILHSHDYDHGDGAVPTAPDPQWAQITYHFSEPTRIQEIEIVQHGNGVTRIEGFVGDSVDSLRSIGEVYSNRGDWDGSGGQFGELERTYFQFPRSAGRLGKVFRFVIRETALVDGYACYRAFPHTDLTPVPDAGGAGAGAATLARRIAELEAALRACQEGSARR
jgi:hypothetical protein